MQTMDSRAQNQEESQSVATGERETGEKNNRCEPLLKIDSPKYFLLQNSLKLK